jgi:glutaredoxin 3
VEGLGSGGSVAKLIELYTTTGCPYSAAAREDLEWRGVDFVEYDVEKDGDAYERMLDLTGGNRTVPVIVEEGKPVQIGWMGQGCFV